MDSPSPTFSAPASPPIQSSPPMTSRNPGPGSSRTWHSRNYLEQKLKEAKQKTASINTTAMRKLYFADISRWNHPRNKNLNILASELPLDHEVWLEFRSDVHEARVRGTKRRAETMQAASLRERCGIPRLRPFPGREFKDSRSTVLALPTIWTHHWETSERNSHRNRWPTTEELVYEGFARWQTTRVRMMPAVRDWEPDDPTIDTEAGWRVLPIVRPLPFDDGHGGRIPCKEDLIVPDPIPDQEIPNLLNEDLLEAMDEEWYL